MNRPHLNEIKTWSLKRVREQYKAEQAEHRRLLNVERDLTHDQLSRLYRLCYMRWLLNGSPQPQPGFV